jgi:hypothetical protein
MAATTDMISHVKGMVGDALLSSVAVTAAIERYPVVDGLGNSPFVEGSLTEVNPNWTPTYDLHAAVVDLLEEKAAQLVKDFDFATENDRFERSQKYSQMMALIRWHRSRRKSHGIPVVNWPPSEVEDAA